MYGKGSPLDEFFKIIIPLAIVGAAVIAVAAVAAPIIIVSRFLR